MASSGSNFAHLFKYKCAIYCSKGLNQFIDLKKTSIPFGSVLIKSLHNKIVFLSSGLIGVKGSNVINLFKPFNFSKTSFIFTSKNGSFSWLFIPSGSFWSLFINFFLLINSKSSSNKVSLNSSITLLNSFTINNSLNGFLVVSF